MDYLSLYWFNRIIKITKYCEVLWKLLHDSLDSMSSSDRTIWT